MRAHARCRDDEFGTRRWFFVTRYYPFTIIVSSRFGHKELNLISPLVYNIRFRHSFLPSLRLERSSETSRVYLTVSSRSYLFFFFFHLIQIQCLVSNRSTA